MDGMSWGIRCLGGTPFLPSFYFGTRKCDENRDVLRLGLVWPKLITRVDVCLRVCFIFFFARFEDTHLDSLDMLTCSRSPGSAWFSLNTPGGKDLDVSCDGPNLTGPDSGCF